MTDIFSEQNLEETLTNKQRQVFSELVKGAEIHKVGHKTTICLLVCRNGFEVVGSSQCMSPKGYDRDIGARVALSDAMDSLVEIHAYEMHPHYVQEFDEEE